MLSVEWRGSPPLHRQLRRMWTHLRAQGTFLRALSYSKTDCAERTPTCSPSLRASWISSSMAASLSQWKARAVHSCQRYAVVLGGCLRAIV